MNNFESRWIIKPELGFVDILSEYGRFLVDDYRMINESLIIPHSFEPYLEDTGRKFLIIGDYDSPWMLAKTVFLCIKLAGPSSIVVSTPNIDEAFLVQSVFDNHSNEKIVTKLILNTNNDLNVDKDILEEVKEATDIIVFGNENKSKVFREYETVDKRVWERSYKFSFGIIREDDLTPTNINQICFDFFSFYGEGSLAPKFYFVVGKLKKKHSKQFSETIIAFYENLLQSYRSKLPFIKKADLVKHKIMSQYVAKYIRYDDLNSSTLFDNLYGDVRLISVEDLGDIEEFIKKWSDRISTVAINVMDDLETLDMLEDNMVMRICDYGSMQFPDFFEQYDTVDDFIIYSKEEDQDDPFMDPENYI